MEADEPAFSPAANDSWRTWLMTGARREPVDRRRVRGSHVGLKRMLVEGMKTPIDTPYSWKGLSDAMVRQSVGEAMRKLPSEDAQLVRLAYFGGCTNRDLADRFRVTESAVQRRLRRALGMVSEYVERGRSFGRTVVCAAGVWLSSRWLEGAGNHIVQATAFAGMAAIVMAQPPVPIEGGGGSITRGPALVPPAAALHAPVAGAQVSQASPSAGQSAAASTIGSLPRPVQALLPSASVSPVSLPRLPAPLPVVENLVSGPAPAVTARR
ncbi:MAG TPA: sigma factor-like helix-turn-helix DNA-binding protein [Candidatus Sulfotelmatobacter sp.]|nr:sigma factor-like helix-turn-helix DNA-binding protein [Candidatus Sulfotelmatobacter sp.]